MTDEATKDYKDTVNLPKTDFPMKGNLTQLEPKMLAHWEEKKTYEALIQQNSAKPAFVLHDGPPYANGHLHAGHALNKVLKDIVVKYRNMTGSLTEFIPGWDCHGLPIEQAVEKRLRDKKIDKKSLSRDEFLQKCREYALEFIDIQREEFKRMGVFGKWSEPYRTLDFPYEAQEIRELAQFAKAEALYRKKKPVYWCIQDATALAEAEVEYEDHESPSVYVAFPALGNLNEKWSFLKNKKVSFVIWTTTPWTLPANLAIAANPKLEYVFYQFDERVLVVAKELLPRFLSQVASAHEHLKTKTVEVKGEALEAESLVDAQRILGYAMGDELSGLVYQHVFYDRQGKVVLGDHVTTEAGTGLVHTAPGHGQEDYEMGLQYGLDIYNPVKNDGRYDDTVGPEFAGMKVLEANPKVIEILVQKGVLLNAPTDTVKHSYPHCWRCHKPIIFRATHQWFISLEKTQLRQNALKAIDGVQWVPKWGRERIYSMLEGRPDWCISRQRTWGVPIPVALCEGCDEAYVSSDLMEKVAGAVEKEGAGVWYRTDLKAFLPEGAKCPKCQKDVFRRETDILDVWFDSACSFAAVAGKRQNLKVPVDLYLEGSDQHRGWFHSSLLVGVGAHGMSPYKACLTHGFVVDGQGRKMSKSLGNTVSPEQIIKQYGAEVMRLWVASSDYRDDVRLSDQILKGLSEGYRKIRNTLRYALSNLYDFDVQKDSVEFDSLLPLDKWALGRLQQLVTKVTLAYENYEFHLVYHSVVDFCAMDLSSLYFDILKDRLYTSKADSEKRRSAQTVLHRLSVDLLRLLAPIMSFTAEEAWSMLSGRPSESVFLGGFPKVDVKIDEALAEEYDKLFAVRAAVQPLLEAARRDKMIGASLEAKVVLTATGEAAKFLSQHAKDLASVFIVSQVQLANTASEGAQPLSLGQVFENSTLHAEVYNADGQKCPRCWAYSKEVVSEGDICPKCEEALRSP